MEEENTQGTEMKDVRLKKEAAAAAASFSVIVKTTNSTLVSAEQHTYGEATPTPQLCMCVWAIN